MSLLGALQTLVGRIQGAVKGILGRGVVAPASEESESNGQGSVPERGSMRDRAAEITARSIAECFDRKESPDGQKWLPLKYPDKPRPHKALVLSGELMFEAIRAGRTLEVRDDGFVASLDRPDYAGWQNFGTDDGHIPAREFFGLNEDAKNELTGVVGEAAISFLVNGLFSSEEQFTNDHDKVVAEAVRDWMQP
jgi:phage gpG-like protein